jgi:hypothetical protein
MKDFHRRDIYDGVSSFADFDENASDGFPTEEYFRPVQTQRRRSQ